MERKRQTAPKNVLLEVGNRAAHEVTELVHARAEVALGIQLFIEPAVLEALFETGDFFTALAVLQRLKHCLCAQQAGLHGGVGALDLGAVQRAGVTAQQQAAREAHLRQGVEATLGNGTGAIGHSLAAFQVLLDLRMQLQALELVERAHVRVVVRQVRDQAYINLTVLKVIKEGAPR